MENGTLVKRIYFSCRYCEHNINIQIPIVHTGLVDYRCLKGAADENAFSLLCATFESTGESSEILNT